jgi:Na+-driven multidrug efflux pump
MGYQPICLTCDIQNVGAENPGRARRTWIAALLAVGFTEMVGLFVAILPTAWLCLFGHDPAVVRIGALYLCGVGPVYGAIGLGMLLYFASQGIARASFLLHWTRDDWQNSKDTRS